VQIDAGRYVIRASGGRDMRLRVDNTTTFDRNITVGDKVVAITNPMPSDAPYVTTMYRLDSPHIVQGEVVWTDENEYVVRDFTGRDVRLRSSSATARNDDIRVGIESSRIRVHPLLSMWIRLLNDNSCFFRIVTHAVGFSRTGISQRRPLLIDASNDILSI